MHCQKQLKENILLLIQQINETGNAAKLEIRNYVDAFSVIKKNYEDVFSETRFLNNPVDYQLDQNPNRMLANATNNSDRMYVYELAMNNKVKDWLAN